MKKNLLIIACFSTFAHGMETNSLNIIPDCCKASLTLHNTIINVTKGPISAANEKVDLIVVGDNQQRMLRHPSFCDIPDVGTINYPENHIIYENSNSYSHENTTYLKAKKLQQQWNESTHNIMSCPVMRIAEPCITREYFYNYSKEAYVKDFVYDVSNPDKNDRHGSFRTFCGDQAIKQASLDLMKCYSIALKAGLQKLDTKKEKIIAFPTLAKESFPIMNAANIALAAIFEFINDYREAYHEIRVLVANDPEHEEYKKLFQEIPSICAEYT